MPDTFLSTIGLLALVPEPEFGNEGQQVEILREIPLLSTITLLAMVRKS